MAVFSNVSPQNPIPLIIDTDPGEDADDAVTLSMIVNSKEVSVKLIVTTNEDIDHESNKGHYAAYAKEIFQRWGVDQKIYQGATLGNHKFICHNMLPADWKTRPPAETNHFDAIREILETHEKVAYLSIGPMTNLARLLDQPWFQDGRLRDRMVVIQMGGWFEPGQVEYNIMCDPVSAKKVFHSGLSIHLVTYDTTKNARMEVTLESNLYKRLSSSDHGGHQLLAAAYRAFHNTYPFNPFLNDPLSFSAIFNDFVQFDRLKVDVDENTGATFLSDTGAEIMVSRPNCDHDGFMNFVHDRLLLNEAAEGS